MALCFAEVVGRRDPRFEEAHCLVIASPDQDPFFRLARDAAERLGLPKPTVLYLDSVPGLEDPASKMSASDPSSCIFIRDGPEEIRAKLRRAFSVGGETMAAHRSPPPDGWPVHQDLTCILGRIYGGNGASLATVIEEFRWGRVGSVRVKGEVTKILVEALKGFRQGLDE